MGRLPLEPGNTGQDPVLVLLLALVGAGYTPEQAWKMLIIMVVIFVLRRYARND